MATATKKIDPFKVKSSKTGTARPKAGQVKTPDDIASAVDSYREAQDKVKHFEGEAAMYKDTILAYTKSEYCRRALDGDTANFKVSGKVAQAMYIVMDASSGLTEEDRDLVVGEFGEKAAEELIERDFRSLKFNAEVLEANYEAVVAALQKLPPEILETHFSPMMMKTSKEVISKAKKHAKDEAGLQRLIEILKVKNYIR